MSEFRQMQLLRLATVLSFMLAIVNHLLPPKAFAATQLLFDYSQGFARRGLVGQALDFLLGATVSVGEIYLTAALITLVGAFGLFVFLSRNLPETRSAYMVIILALNSFAFASFVGNTGYLDGLLLVIAVVALSIDGRGWSGGLARLGLVALGVLIHENMLPYFAVLIGFDLWLARKGSRDARVVALLPVVVGAVTLALLVAFARFTPEQAQAFADGLQARAAFGLDPNSTVVVGRSIGDNFALMSELRGTTKYWTWVLFDGAPLFLMSLWLIWLGRKLLAPGARPLTALLLAGAVLAPLSLNFIAFDVVRFGVVSTLAGFMVIALLIRHDPEARARLEQVLSWPLFVVLLVLNANIFTMQVNILSGHTSQFPWVLLTQLKWFSP
ncbi:MAG: hypothetical protein GXP05_01965 [Alphaproteobacteria bacterium]|nr:hypothetical protein [Alphaproteobacteria bacterium]